MRAWQTLSLAAWRELRGRSLPLLGPAILTIAASPLERDVRDAADMTILAFIIPTAIAVLALRPGAASDVFWRGLGGPPLARSIGMLGTQALFIVATVIAVSLRLSGGQLAPRGEPWLALVALAAALALVLLWTLGHAARALAAGSTTVGGMILGVAVLVAGFFLSLRMWHWPPALGLLFRGSVLAVLALGCAVRWESRFGSWGGAILPAARWEALAALGVALLGPLALEAAAPGLLRGFQRLSIEDISEDGREAIISSEVSNWMLRGGHLLRWRDGRVEEFGPPGGFKFRQGPRGAQATEYLRSWPWSDSQERELRVTFEGGVVSCPSNDTWGFQWDPRGQRLVGEGRPGTPALVVSPDGCSRENLGHQLRFAGGHVWGLAGWSEDTGELSVEQAQRLSRDRGTLLRDGARVEGLPAGSVSWLSRFRGRASTLAPGRSPLNAVVAVHLGQPQPRYRDRPPPRPRELRWYDISGGTPREIPPIVPSPGSSAWLPDHSCVIHAAAPPECVGDDLRLHPVAAPEGTWVAPLGNGLFAALGELQLIRAADGRRWPLRQLLHDSRWSSSFDPRRDLWRIGRLRLVDDRPRVFGRGRIRELHDDGTVRELPLH